MACLRQRRARLRDDRRGRAFLDRYRVAERRFCHHVYHYCGPLARAARRSGLRGRLGFLGGRRPWHGRRRYHWICCFAHRRDLPRLLHRDRALFDSGRRGGRPAVANRDIHRHDLQFHSAARAREPDDLRHRAVL